MQRSDVKSGTNVQYRPWPPFLLVIMIRLMLLGERVALK